MIRWPIQIAALLMFALALWWCVRVYRRSLVLRPYLSWLIVWLVHEVVFSGVMVARIILCGGEPPMELWALWWANVAWLHSGIAAAGTFWVLWRRVRD